MEQASFTLELSELDEVIILVGIDRIILGSREAACAEISRFPGEVDYESVSDVRVSRKHGWRGANRRSSFTHRPAGGAVTLILRGRSETLATLTYQRC
jgi:hypothetical protein